MRQFMFTASIMASLTLNACSKDAAVVKPQAIFNEINQRSNPPKASVLKYDQSNLPKRFQGLYAQDISREEIDEHIVLEEKQREKYRKNEKDHRKAIAVWKQKDPSNRGPEVYVPNVLSREEADELTALQQAELDIRLEQKKKLQAWTDQDQGTRGAIPNISAIYQYDSNPRLWELLKKTLTANQDILHPGHNTSLSDNERIELSELKKERRRIDGISRKVGAVLQKDSPLDWQNLMNTLPKDLLQRSINVEFRIEEIEGPHDAEKKADRIKTRLMRLSRETGVTISPDEIDETITLNTEKDRIRRRTKLEGVEKWLAEGGDYSDRYMPTDEDYARLKEIDARVKEISAPLDEVKNLLAFERGLDKK